jgi:hypothetical protein
MFSRKSIIVGILQAQMARLRALDVQSLLLCPPLSAHEDKQDGETQPQPR